MRIDDNQPSAAQEAAQQDRKRTGVKGKDAAGQSSAAQQAAKAQAKNSKSAFDQVLEQFTQPAFNASQEAAKFDSKIKEVLSDQEKKEDSSDKKKDRKDDDKKSSREEKETSSSHKPLSSREKIVSKQDLGGRSSGGGQGGSGGGDSQGSGSRQTKMGGDRNALSPLGFQTGGKLQSLQSPTASQSLKNTTALPKAILDQIVQHVRVSVGKGIRQEIQLDLSDKVFRGLSLKVISQQGKIQVTFLTANPDVRRLFDGQKGAIREALLEKGIAISDIRVQFSGA